MKENFKEEFLEEEIDKRIKKHLAPINKELKKFDKLITKLYEKKTVESEALIRQLIKQTDLFTRLKVYLEMEYIVAVTPPNSADEIKEQKWIEARDKAIEQVNWILYIIKKWQNDDAPLISPDKYDNKKE